MNEESWFIKSKESILNNIQKAREGRGVYLTTPFKVLGISQNTYTLLGADPGAGKTAFLDYTYVISPCLEVSINQSKQIEYEVLYFALERSKEIKLAKMGALMLFSDSKGEILLNEKHYLGRANNVLIPEDIFARYKKSLESLGKIISSRTTIVDKSVTARDILGRMINLAKKNGEVKNEVWDKDNLDYYAEYYPYNDRKIINVIIDHAALIKSNKGDKETLDELSKYLRIGRDIFNFSVVLVSQFNRSNTDMKRRQINDFLPERSDFKGTGNTYEDADLVLGIMNPYKYQVKTTLGFEVSKFRSESMKNRFRTLTILKNSFGIDDVSMGLLFIGEVGLFIPLDKYHENFVYPDKLINCDKYASFPQLHK